MTTSRNDRPAHLIGSSALSAPELHDFSDLRSADHRPNRILRWGVGIAAVLVAGHFALGIAETTPQRQASIGEASATQM